jgi:hypothetical protein
MLFTQEPKRHPTRRRIATVVLAPIVALGGWALIRLAGIDLTVSVDPGTVRAGDVFAAALVAALGAWGVVLLLERYTRSPRRWWPFIGSTALALSVIGPSYLADGASAAALIGLHVITAVVVITGFAPTLSVACDPRADAACLPASG